MNTKKLKLISTTLSTSVFFISNAIIAAPVNSTSLEIFKDAESPFWEVSVNCENAQNPRIITKDIQEDQWCSSDISTLCDSNKFLLSQKLCSDNFDQIAKAVKDGKPLEELRLENEAPKPPASSEKQVSSISNENVNNKKSSSKVVKKVEPASPRSVIRENLIKEQIQIEEQRILIQQKRLELQRLELSLQKRQLDS